MNEIVPDLQTTIAVSKTLASSVRRLEAELARITAQRDRLREFVRSLDHDLSVEMGVDDETDEQLENNGYLQSGDMTD